MSGRDMCGAIAPREKKCGGRQRLPVEAWAFMPPPTRGYKKRKWRLERVRKTLPTFPCWRGGRGRMCVCACNIENSSRHSAWGNERTYGCVDVENVVRLSPGGRKGTHVCVPFQGSLREWEKIRMCVCGSGKRSRRPQWGRGWTHVGVWKWEAFAAPPREGKRMHGCARVEKHSWLSPRRERGDTYACAEL